MSVKNIYNHITGLSAQCFKILINKYIKIYIGGGEIRNKRIVWKIVDIC